MWFWGFLFISVFGTINHFMYDILGRNKFAAYFFAVNESTWEHMKLVVFPSVVWLLISLFVSDNPNILIGNFAGLIVMLILIPFLFYFLRLIFGKTSSIVNILIFHISVFVGSLVNKYYLGVSYVGKGATLISAILYIFVVVLFIIFSKNPGKSFLFDEPYKWDWSKYLIFYFMCKNRQLLTTFGVFEVKSGR